MRQNLFSKTEIDYLHRQKLSAFKMPYKDTYKSRIVEKIQPSMDCLIEIISHTHNLNKDKITKGFNARSLYDLIKNLIVNTESDKRLSKTKNYDFKTIELARMMSEIMLDYLKQSPIFKNNKSVQTDIQRVSDHFLSLSEHGLEKDVHKDGILTKEQEVKLRKEREDVFFQYIKPLSKTKVQRLENKLNELNKKQLIEKDKNKQKQLSNQIIKLQKERSNFFDPKLEKRMREIIQKLVIKYNHLEPFSCPINPLPEFENSTEKFLAEKHKKTVKELGKNIPTDIIIRFIDETVQPPIEHVTHVEPDPNLF